MTIPNAEVKTSARRWPLGRVLRWGGAGVGVLALLGLALGYTPDTDPAAMRAKYGAAPSQFVDAGEGLTVHVRDTGPRDAPVLVLVHGSNASLHTWEPWAERLDARFRVVRLDLPGHGLTGAAPGGDYRNTAYADVVDRVTRQLGLARFAIGGNSMGGGVAWHYALAHPDRISALILVDSVGQPEPSGSTPIAFRIARLPVLRDLAATITPRRLIADSLPPAYADPAHIDDNKIDLYWELLRYPGNRAATMARFATPSEPATPGMLRRLTMPTLILWGAQDRLIPLASGRWLAANIPGSRLIVYSGAGHLPMEERPDQSAADVDRFLGGVNGAKPDTG